MNRKPFHQDTRFGSRPLLRAFGWLAGLLLAATSLATAGPATAADFACSGDNTRVCAPVTNLTFSTNGVETPVTIGKDGNGQLALSTDARDVTVKLTSSASMSGRFAHIQFFELSPGLSMAIAQGNATTRVGCDPGAATGNGCYIRVGSDGSATFSLALSGVTTTSKMRVQINGSAGWVSRFAQITFERPYTVSADSPESSSAVVGSQVSTTFKVLDAAGNPVVGTTVKFTTTGVGKLSATSALTDSKGLAVVKASLGTSVVGNQVISASASTPNGMVAQATATIKWKNKPAFSISTSTGKFSVKISNAQGLPVLIKYGAEKWELLVAASDSQTVSITTAKGSYSVTIQIGTVRSVKAVTVP